MKRKNLKFSSKKEDAEKDKKHFEKTYIGNEEPGYASITPIEAI